MYDLELHLQVGAPVSSSLAAISIRTERRNGVPMLGLDLEPVSFSVRSMLRSAHEDALYESVSTQSLWSRTNHGVRESWRTTATAWRMAKRSVRAFANPWARFAGPRRAVLTMWRFLGSFHWSAADAFRILAVCLSTFAVLYLTLGA